MIKSFNNTQKVKEVYTFNVMPVDTFDFVQNISYCLGSCTWNNDSFSPYLDKLVANGTLKKIYDVDSDGFREASYEFTNGTGEIDFFGQNHMTLTLNYNF